MSDLKKWFPFKFDRKTGKRASAPDSSLQRRSTREDPVERMNQEMNQMLRGFFGGDDWFLPAFRSMSETPSWFGDFRPRSFSPSIDVSDTESALVVSAEIPGLSKEDIELTVHDGTLSLKGEKRHEFEKDEAGVYRTERFFGTFQRTVPLPAGVDPDGAEAQFADGVLTVKLPKVAGEETAPRRIDLG